MKSNTQIAYELHHDVMLANSLFSTKLMLTLSIGNFNDLVFTQAVVMSLTKDLVFIVGIRVA